MTGLANGAKFPELTMDRVGGGKLKVPEEALGSYGVVLAYRGSWCMRCNEQLASYQRMLEELSSEDIRVTAFSTDDEENARKMVDDHQLEFPVGFGVDMAETAKTLEGYVNVEHQSLESSNFLLRPDGTIELSVYASSSVGRLTPQDVLDIVRRRRTR